MRSKIVAFLFAFILLPALAPGASALDAKRVYGHWRVAQVDVQPDSAEKAEAELKLWEEATLDIQLDNTVALQSSVSAAASLTFSETDGTLFEFELPDADEPLQYALDSPSEDWLLLYGHHTTVYLYKDRSALLGQWDCVRADGALDGGAASPLAAVENPLSLSVIFTFDNTAYIYADSADNPLELLYSQSGDAVLLRDPAASAPYALSFSPDEMRIEGVLDGLELAFEYHPSGYEGYWRLERALDENGDAYTEAQLAEAFGTSDVVVELTPDFRVLPLSENGLLGAYAIRYTVDGDTVAFSLHRDGQTTRLSFAAQPGENALTLREEGVTLTLVRMEPVAAD